MDEPAIVVGRIVKPHGVRGELLVENRSDNPERWELGSVVFTADARKLTVRSARSRSGKLVVAFEELSDREEAEALRGVELSVPESWLPALPEGEWWAKDLEGCRVMTESGRDLGVVAEVIPNPANDLWVAMDEEGRETLVPALKDVLVDVDVGAKRILVRDVPGLTAPEEKDPPEAV